MPASGGPAPRRMNMEKKIRTICTQDSAPVDLAQHSRKCTVCRHPDREAIEEAFVQWHSVGRIAVDFDLEESTVYRHAHAFGLFAPRQRNMRFALELMIEHAEDVPPTAVGIISAIRACSRLNDHGEWVDAPTTHIVLAGASSPAAPSLEAAEGRTRAIASPREDTSD